MDDDKNNYDDPKAEGYGQYAGEAAAPRKKTLHRVGRPEEYTSIYGYQKNRLPVRVVNADGTDGETVGWIKEEVVPDENGNIRGRVYYERNGWKKQGQLRFYSSPAALLAAVGMELWDGTVQHGTDAPDADQPGDAPASDGEDQAAA